MDMYGLGMSGLPPEYQAQYRSLQQQQMIAQSLLAQSQESLGNQAPGVAVSPFQGLAKVAQAYMGAKAMNKANDAYAGIGQKYQADQNSAIEKVKGALVKPATPIPLANADGVAGTTVDRPIPEQRTALVDAMMSQFPNVRSFATSRDAQLNNQEAREDTQAFRTQTFADNREQRNLERQLAVEERMRQEAIQERVRKEQFDQQKELKQLVAQQGQSPYFTPVQTAGGVMSFNARTGKMEPVNVNGAPVVGAQHDPNLQGQIAGAKAGGKEMGEAGAKAKLDLPTTIDKASLASQQIDELLSHPGFTSTVGATLKPGARFVDGTHEADFMKRLDQLKGGAFLQAFESLKGGGQITEVEGKKATDAINRMEKSQSEKEFRAAALEFKGFVNKGIERAKIKAGGGTQIPNKLGVQGPSSVDALLEKYK